MKQVWKLGTAAVIAFAVWISLLLQESSSLPRQVLLALPLYALVMLGCYGLAMVGYGLMVFPTCPQEALLLQKDIVEAKAFLQQKGVDVSLREN